MDEIRDQKQAALVEPVDYQYRCEILEALLRDQYAKGLQMLAALGTKDKTICGLRDSNEKLRRRNGVLKALLREKEEELS